MANGHGGLRRPAHPAPASGPGRLSKRTDGGPGQKLLAPTGMDYGAHAALMAQESTAPMSATPPTPGGGMPAGMPAAAPSGPAYSGVPFGAPTQRPNEPVTHGADIGPGAGSAVLPVEHQPAFVGAGPMTQMLSQLSARDTTGVLSSVLAAARAQGA